MLDFINILYSGAFICYILFMTSFIAVKTPITTLKAAKASKNCVTTVPSYRHIAAKWQHTTAAHRSMDKFARLYGVGSCVTKGYVIGRDEATVHNLYCSLTEQFGHL